MAHTQDSEIIFRFIAVKFRSQSTGTLGPNCWVFCMSLSFSQLRREEGLKHSYMSDEQR